MSTDAKKFKPLHVEFKKNKNGPAEESATKPRAARKKVQDTKPETAHKKPPPSKL